MQISCPKCQAEYELDPPAAPFARDQDLVFRCSGCGTSIPLRAASADDSAEETDDPDTDVQEAPRPTPTPQFVLKQEGNSYHVKDEAMLQRWIAERRVWPDDQISVQGGPWTRVGGIEKYSVFFKLVDDAERSVPASQPQAEERKPSNLSVSVKPGLFAKPGAMTVISEEKYAPTEDQSASDETPSSAPADVFGEVLPDEDTASLPLSPDDPTMDMELEEEDFFSEEQSAVAGPHDYSSSSVSVDDDDDELFEWRQHRRRNMVMWWLMFLGALGAVAYLSLDYLNQRDQAKAALQAKTVEVDPAPVEEPIDVAVPPTDTGAGSVEPPREAELPPPSDAEPIPVEPPPKVEKAPEKKPDTTPSAKPPTATPATGRTVNVAAEVARGWAQIDRSNWAKARMHFDNVVRAQPGNADGRLGLAYVNENQGRVAEAVAQYCRLAATASGDVKIEASGRLRALGKDCP